MGVIIRAFYNGCTTETTNEWWVEVNQQAETLSQAGFTAIWLPPPFKGTDDGFLPYDYYDLGEWQQLGTTHTQYGSKKQLSELVETLHELKLQVYTDLPLAYCYTDDSTPRSNRFVRAAEHVVANKQETGQTLLNHQYPDVYKNVLDLAQYLLTDVGYDGFFYTDAQLLPTWLINALQNLQYTRQNNTFRPIGVCNIPYDDVQWLQHINHHSPNNVFAIDNILRNNLHHLCFEYDYDLRRLQRHKYLFCQHPLQTITLTHFQNIEHEHEQNAEKMLAYAFILTHEGYPCVWWKDYFANQLAQKDKQTGIDALIAVHEQHAGGSTTVLYADHYTYIMQRNGFEQQRGLILVINNRGDYWSENWIQTRWNNTRFEPVAWYSEYADEEPSEKWSHNEGWLAVAAPPRGYVVYVPYLE